jgi:hypothetical protein
MSPFTFSLGGQHGEESNEGEDEVCGEEAGGQKDREEKDRKEEVSMSCSAQRT